MIETRLLQSFLVVAEELHFGRAAARLHLTQPPLTRQIQQLEEHLGGVPLFDRSRRQIELTEAGRALAIDGRRILDQLDRAADRAQKVARGEAGRLRIGFVSTANYSVLPSVLNRFRARHPDVTVELLESTADEQLRLLGDGALDAGVVIANRPGPDLASVPLYREPLLAVLPTNHRRARRRGALPLGDLADDPFVLFPRERAPDLYDAVITFARRAGVSLRVAQTALQMQTIIGLVAGGLGVSIVPACMENLRRSDVVYKRLAPKSPTITTHLVWRADDTSKVLASFVRVGRR